MTQLIENTVFRTVQMVMTDGQLTTIPWPSGFVSGTVLVNANSTSVAGIIHARSGVSPILAAMATPLANLTVSSSDISATPPASGTGKITVGRTSVGLQVHSGGALTTSVTFIG